MKFSRVSKLTKYHLPLVLFAGFIFYLSSLSEQPVIRPETLGGLNFWLRKLTHVVEYVVLYFLALRSFKIENFKKYKLSALVFCLLFAMSDEWHQTFVFGREGKVFDVFIDMIGIILFYLLDLFHKTSKIFLKFFDK